MASPVYAGEHPPKVYYPSVMLNSKEFPPIKTWKVGQTYEVTVTLKMTGMHERDKETTGEFDLVSVSV